MFALGGIYLNLSTITDTVSSISARMPRGETKLPNVYIIAEVKDPKKICRKEVKWCYWSGANMACSTDEKNLPDDVTHLKVCAQ